MKYIIGYLIGLALCSPVLYSASRAVKSLTWDGGNTIVATTFGGESQRITSKKNKWQKKVSAVNHTTNATEVVTFTDVPAGLYRLTVGARSFKADTADQNIYVTPKVNGGLITDYYSASTSVVVGLLNASSIVDAIRNIYGLNSTFYIELTATSDITLDVVVTDGNIEYPYMILETTEDLEETSQW